MSDIKKEHEVGSSIWMKQKEYEHVCVCEWARVSVSLIRKRGLRPKD